jgi:uncharacterized protein (TIGR03382 family)
VPNRHAVPRRSTLAFASLVALASPSVLHAAPTTPEAPVSSASGHFWGDTVVTPGSRDLAAEIEPKAVRQGVLFINFDGANIMMGGDFSQTDSSMIFGQEFAPHGGSEAEKTAIVDAVKVDFELYDIVIVDERPSTGDYTMAVTSPTNPLGGGVLGIAPLDCNDGMPNNVVFAFHGAGDGYSPSGAAGTISHEAGHSYGLEHVDDPTDVMNPANSGGDPTFRDNCTALVDPMVVCGPAHELHCEGGTTQNSHKELLEIFGSSIPDVMAPVVSITAPDNNAYFEAGASFRIDVTATDDDEVRTVQLFEGDAALMTSAMAPFGWDVVDIPEGIYEFTVTATDRVGNVGTSELITVYVGIDPPEDIGTTGDTDGGPGQDGDGGGCGCTQPAGSPVAGLGLVLLGLLRRRRGLASAHDAVRSA